MGTYWSCFGPTLDGLQKPEVMAPAIWVVAPILPDTSTAQEAELLTLLDGTPDKELVRVLNRRPAIIRELDAVKNDEPYLIRQLIGSKLRDQKVVSGVTSTWTAPRSRRPSSRASWRRCSRRTPG